jgi:hypothetical protein
MRDSYELEDKEAVDSMSIDDFKSMLYQSLRNKGVVDSMKVSCSITLPYSYSTM